MITLQDFETALDTLRSGLFGGDRTVVLCEEEAAFDTLRAAWEELEAARADLAKIDGHLVRSSTIPPPAPDYPIPYTLTELARQNG